MKNYATNYFERERYILDYTIKVINGKKLLVVNYANGDNKEVDYSYSKEKEIVNIMKSQAKKAISRYNAKIDEKKNLIQYSNKAILCSTLVFAINSMLYKGFVTYLPSNFIRDGATTLFMSLSFGAAISAVMHMGAKVNTHSELNKFKSDEFCEEIKELEAIIDNAEAFDNEVEENNVVINQLKKTL